MPPTVDQEPKQADALEQLRPLVKWDGQDYGSLVERFIEPVLEQRRRQNADIDQTAVDADPLTDSDFLIHAGDTVAIIREKIARTTNNSVVLSEEGRDVAMLARHVIPAYVDIMESNVARDLAHELGPGQGQVAAFAEIMRRSGEYQDGESLVLAARELDGDTMHAMAIEVAADAAVDACEAGPDENRRENPRIVFRLAHVLWEREEWGAAVRTAIRGFRVDQNDTTAWQELKELIEHQPLNAEGIVAWGRALPSEDSGEPIDLDALEKLTTVPSYYRKT